MKLISVTSIFWVRPLPASGTKGAGDTTNTAFVESVLENTRRFFGLRTMEVAPHVVRYVATPEVPGHRNAAGTATNPAGTANAEVSPYSVGEPARSPS